MKITRRQIRQLIKEELQHTLSEDFSLPDLPDWDIRPTWLKVLGDFFGFEPLPKLAKALSNAKEAEGEDEIVNVSNHRIRWEMEQMDEFDHEGSYQLVFDHKADIPDWWIDAGGALNPWYD